MPRYFFHVRSGGDLTRDPDGAELPDIDAARQARGQDGLPRVERAAAREPGE